MQSKSDKEKEVAMLTEWFNGTQVALCAEYKGLSVTQITELRKNLRKSGSLGKVTKNTLGRIAAEKAYTSANPEELKKFLDMFKNMNMVVFSKNDPVSPARVLAEFAKKNPVLKLTGGFFEGKFLPESGVKELATMPSREESLAKLLGVMNGAARQLMLTMKEPASLLVRVLEARRKQLEEQGGGQA